VLSLESAISHWSFLHSHNYYGSGGGILDPYSDAADIYDAIGVIYCISGEIDAGMKAISESLSLIANYITKSYSLSNKAPLIYEGQNLRNSFIFSSDILTNITMNTTCDTIYPVSVRLLLSYTQSLQNAYLCSKDDLFLIQGTYILEALNETYLSIEDRYTWKNLKMLFNKKISKVDNNLLFTNAINFRYENINSSMKKVYKKKRK
jgi:ABC-type Fe3+-citrate transport system substrate-binding protein